MFCKSTALLAIMVFLLGARQALADELAGKMLQRRQPDPPKPPAERHLDSVSPDRFSPELFDEYKKLPPHVRTRLDAYIGSRSELPAALKADPILRVQLGQRMGGRGPAETAFGAAAMRDAGKTALDLEHRQKRAIEKRLVSIMHDTRHPGMNEAQDATAELIAREWLGSMGVPALLRFVAPLHAAAGPAVRPPGANYAQRRARQRAYLWLQAAVEDVLPREHAAHYWDWSWHDTRRHEGPAALATQASPQTREHEQAPVDRWNRWIGHNWGQLRPEERAEIRRHAEFQGERVQWETPLGVPMWLPYDPVKDYDRRYKHAGPP